MSDHFDDYVLWRMDALEAIVFGNAASARDIFETKLEEVLRDEETAIYPS